MVKLHGDRLRQIALLKDNDTDYDLIVSGRVRTLDTGHAPEFDEFWQYYRSRFGFGGR